MRNTWALKEPYLVPKDDNRYRRQLIQLKAKGYSDSETWALDSVICKFILPRLKRFKEINNGSPLGLTSKEWDAILDEMIFAFEWNISEESDIVHNISEEEIQNNWKRYKKGMGLFAKHFRDLWW